MLQLRRRCVVQSTHDPAYGFLLLKQSSDRLSSKPRHGIAQRQVARAIGFPTSYHIPLSWSIQTCTMTYAHYTPGVCEQAGLDKKDAALDAMRSACAAVETQLREAEALKAAESRARRAAERKVLISPVPSDLLHMRMPLQQLVTK